MSKIYPDHALEDAARAAGATVRCLWQIPGPKDTAIAWVECLSIGSGIVIVQTFDGGGWNALSDCRTNRIDETIADVLARCGVSRMDEPPKPLMFPNAEWCETYARWHLRWVRANYNRLAGD